MLFLLRVLAFWLFLSAAVGLEDWLYSLDARKASALVAFGLAAFVASTFPAPPFEASR